MFHTCLLSPYKENDVHGPNHTNLPPNLINGAQEYEVEMLLAHRQQGRQRQYLVKWKGYDTDIPDVALVINARKQTRGARKPKPKLIFLSSSNQRRGIQDL